MNSHSVLLSTSHNHLSIRSYAWEVICITLKLAKVFSNERCLEYQVSGGHLSMLDLQKLKVHIQTILLASMESGDYLMSDLTLCDSPPQEAFIAGDPRCYFYVDRLTLNQIVYFIEEARGAARVRRLTWKLSQDDLNQKASSVSDSPTSPMDPTSPSSLSNEEDQPKPDMKSEPSDHSITDSHQLARDLAETLSSSPSSDNPS